MSSPQVLTPTQEYPFAFAGSKPIMDPKERFYRHFQQEAITIQEAIGQLGSIAKIGGERQDATDTILAGISRLSSEVSDASGFVPAYDLRTYSKAVKALTDQLNEETAKLAPKSKFQFKRRAANITGVPKASDDDFVPLPSVRGVPSAPAASNEQSSSSSAVQSEKRDSVGDLPSFSAKDYNAELSSRPGTSGVRKPSFSTARDINISDQKGLHIILPATASRATSSGSLTDLTGCVVDMSVPTETGRSAFAGLALKNISRSLIVAGHVSGPAHITGVTDSVIVVAARQVRIHECKNVDVYLYCGSRPIIEDCSGMRFAPIPNCYMGEDADTSANQWDQVDDFKWLKAEHSPNWQVLPAEERLAEEIWTKAVPGGPGLSTNDVLKKVGIASK